MRAVAAPHLFANDDAHSRFLKEAETVQRQVAETFAYLEKLENSMSLMSAQILPLKEQRA